MDSRFAHLYKRDSSVSMIRVKMSRRRSQTQKENRQIMRNMRRHLDQLPEQELSMDASVLEKSVHTQGPGLKGKVDKSTSAVEERKKMLERFKENKALQKEKEKREKEKKGVFKVGLYHPQPLGYLPLNPIVPNTAKTTGSMQCTRVTRSMKQQQQQKLPAERQAAPKKADLGPSTRANKQSAPTNVRGRTATVEPVVRGPATRSSAKSAPAAAPAKAVTKHASDLRSMKTRSNNMQPTAPSAGRGKPMQAGCTESMPSVENKKPADKEVPKVNTSPVKEKLEEAKVTPTSFAPQGFVFQPPSGLKTFQPAPLSPHSADVFLSPSFCFETKMESTSPGHQPPESFSAAPPLSSPPSCLFNPAPVHVPPSSLSPTASPPSGPVEPKHDVPYFRAVTAEETERLTGLSELWESRFDDPFIPEEARDRMRTAVGQARLLMKERFGQFSGLVDDCDLGRGEKITTCSDLQGFWDMVYFQVEDVHKKFNALQEAEARGWLEETKPVTKQKRVVKKPPVAGSKTGAGAGSSAAAKSRLAAVKAAMKAKQAAEKAATASDDTAPASDAPAKPMVAQTVVFQGGFFQVESPVKVPGASRVRRSAVLLPQSSPCVSKLNTPRRQNPFAVSSSSPNPHMRIITTEEAPSTAVPTEISQPAANHACNTHLAENLSCSPKPLLVSPEHHSIHVSPLRVSPTESTQVDCDTSDGTCQIQSAPVNSPVCSVMKESSVIMPCNSPCQSEPEVPVCNPEQLVVSQEPEECIQDTDKVNALSQEQAEETLVTEWQGSPLLSPAGVSPVKALSLKFTSSPSPYKMETAVSCVSDPSSSTMSTTPQEVCVLSPAPSRSAIIPVNESGGVEMAENPDNESIADVDFEQYLQPTACCSLSPAQSTAAERFSLGAVDAEMESPQTLAESHVQDVMMTPTALTRMAPLVFTPWAEQLMHNPLPFTPQQRERVRQSTCDLMMFTPPSSK